MLISKERGTWKTIDGDRVSRGRFNTAGREWLKPQIIKFLQDREPTAFVDPFAGQGHLLDALTSEGFGPTLGFDIIHCKWPRNDSLLAIPPHPGAAIVTNPPYLARHSAKRKRVYERVADYFHRNPSRTDLYQIALDRCQEAACHVVAIVPETFFNSAYPKQSLVHATILEENPFDDTDCPVCVVCYSRGFDEAVADVYRGEERLGRLADIESLRLHPSFDVGIEFNRPDGRIALRAVDLTDPAESIGFMRREELAYDVSGIKVSSRLITYLEIPTLPASLVDSVIASANAILRDFRSRTSDVVLSPFKGNTSDGRRRRRLDYYSARAILELAIRESAVDCGARTQEGLF